MREKYYVLVLDYQDYPVKYYCETEAEALAIVAREESRYSEEDSFAGRSNFVDVHLSTCSDPIECMGRCAGIYP